MRLASGPSGCGSLRGQADPGIRASLLTVPKEAGGDQTEAYRRQAVQRGVRPSHTETETKVEYGLPAQHLEESAGAIGCPGGLHTPVIGAIAISEGGRGVESGDGLVLRWWSAGRKELLRRRCWLQREQRRQILGRSRLWIAAETCGN
jgi:hypothetical protein